MSAASLSMLEQLMIAEAQECIFKGLLLPASATPDICPDQLQLAQEAAQVRARSPAQKPDLVATQRVRAELRRTGTELGWSQVREGWAPASSALCHSLKPVAVPAFLEVLRIGTEPPDAQVWLSLESRERLLELGAE